MEELRQKVLVLYGSNSGLDSDVIGWSLYDGTGKESMSSGDSDTPPYESILDAMKDGWRVVQFPVLQPAVAGFEHDTAYLKFEFILEKMENINV